MGLLQQPVGLLPQGVALALLGAVVHQRHPGPLHALLAFHIKIAHQSKLHQIFRRAFRIGAAVHQNGLSAVLLGHQRPQRRPPDALDALCHQRRPCQQRAGGAGGDHGVGLPLRQHPKAHAHAGILLLPDGCGGLVLHGNDLRGRNDGDMPCAPALQQRGEPGLVAGKENIAAVALRCQNGALHRRLRRVVAAHGV